MTVWTDAQAGDKITVEVETNGHSKAIDPYCCIIKALVGPLQNMETVVHIQNTFFFLTDEGGTVDGTVLSTRYQPSPIPAGGLEIPLLLTFRCLKYTIHEKMTMSFRRRRG